MRQARCERIVLATRNRHKTLELRALLTPLGLPLHSLAEFPDVTTVDESGLSIQENARRKATGYARQLGDWVLADDTGLHVQALRGAPGVRSSRYAGQQATAAQNRAKLLSALQAVPADQRAAQFVCSLAIADPLGTVIAESHGVCRGQIRHEPAGEAGFGYDALFEIREYQRTLGELGPEVTQIIGHRGRAVRRLLTLWYIERATSLTVVT